MISRRDILLAHGRVQSPAVNRQPGRGFTRARRLIMFAGCCELCGAAANAAYAPLCRPCWSALPMMGPACCRCSVPLPRAGICGRCALSPPEFSRTIAAFRYQLPVDHLIQQFKYAGRVDLAMVLAAAIVQSVAHLQPRPDCIIPVPLHPARQRGRGFNGDYPLTTSAL